MNLNDFVLAKARPFPVLILADTSGSMYGNKDQRLNAARRDMLADTPSPLTTWLSQHLDPSALRAAALGAAARAQKTPERAALGPVLSLYGRDLVALAAASRIPPVTGRRAKMLQVARTLSQATKNNPRLIGEAGLGKTAVVEGLAWRIACGTVPESLRDKRIVEINVGCLPLLLNSSPAMSSSNVNSRR